MPLLRSKLTFVSAAVLVGSIGVLFARTYLRQRALAQEIARATLAITHTEAQNKELAELLAYFANPEHLEKEARVRLNLKKPGEEVLVLRATPHVTASSVVPAPPASVTFSFAPFTDFLKSFFGIEKTRLK